MSKFLHHSLSINISPTIYWDCTMHVQLQQCGTQTHDLAWPSSCLGKKHSHFREAEKEFEQSLGHGLLITCFWVKINCGIPQTRMIHPDTLLLSQLSPWSRACWKLFLGLLVSHVTSFSSSLPPILSLASVPFKMLWKHVCAWRPSSSLGHLQKHSPRPSFSCVSIGLWFRGFALCVWLSCYTVVW